MKIHDPYVRLLVFALLATSITLFSTHHVATSPRRAPEGMVWIPGGRFWMGSVDDFIADARPQHEVELAGFWMDRTEVTNAQFEAFVRSTGYVTLAERTPTAEEFPGAPPENLVAGAAVFSPPAHPVSFGNPYAWWRYVAGASWRHPEGPTSNLDGRDRHPVVQVAWRDAAAYCAWQHKRLPTEAEFERAARGGLDRKRFAWGDELRPSGRWLANVWQGEFPSQNTAEDGFRGLAPVGSFPPNGYGLYDMIGNAWEWCSDWYRPDYYQTLGGAVARNPRGPADSFDPGEPGVTKRVQRGGSFLCSDQYCTRYYVAARGKGDPDGASSNLGFRCVR